MPHYQCLKSQDRDLSYACRREVVCSLQKVFCNNEVSMYSIEASQQADERESYHYQLSKKVQAFATCDAGKALLYRLEYSTLQISIVQTF